MYNVQQHRSVEHHQYTVFKHCEQKSPPPQETVTEVLVYISWAKLSNTLVYWVCTRNIQKQ